MSLDSLLKRTAAILPFLFVTWMGLAIYLTLFPSELITSAAKLGNPKLGHVILFGGWTLLFGLTLMIYFERTRISIPLVVLSGITFGALVEMMQFLMPFDRSGSLLDIGFNTVGALLAGGLLLFYRWQYDKEPLSEPLKTRV